MITRKLGKLLRGKISPFHLYSACILGSLIAFLPVIREAPGLYVLWLSLLVILNANLFLGAIATLLGTLVSLLLLPLSFQLGRLLLDGPLSPLFVWLINAPVTAWFGFENYVATGGMIPALAFGVGLGALMTHLVRRGRRAMATWESHPESFEKWSGKWYVRVPAWILFGGVKGTAAYAELAELRGGNPIRTLGVVLVGVFLLFLGILTLFFQEYIVTAQTRSALERVHGATVDLESTELNLREGSFRIQGLAMADPDALDRNLFAASLVDIELSMVSLLRRKFAVDRMVIEEGRSGTPRTIPGQRVGPRPKPPKEPEEWGLEDYLREARIWKERLSLARRWMERLSPPSDDEEVDPDRPGLAERLRQRAEAQGYARVRAEHLIAGRPRLTIHELRAGGVRVDQLPDQLLDIEAHYLSTHPSLLSEATRISIRSRDDTLGLALSLGRASAQGSGNQINFHRDGIPMETIRSGILAHDAFPFQDGSVDLRVEGDFDPAALELPLQARFRNTNLSLPGVGTTRIDELDLTIGVHGTLDNPRISIPGDVLTGALRDAGRTRLLDAVRGRLDPEGDSSEDVQDRAGRLLEGFRRRSSDQ